MLVPECECATGELACKKKVFRSQLLYFKNAHFNLPASLPRHFNMGNVASGKRRRTTVAGDWTKPTFDVDESVAAAVFAHVTNARDRLALASVSRVWRNVATTDGCWGTCDLVLDGELGKKITDERFENLLRYCGDVKPPRRRSREAACGSKKTKEKGSERTFG